MFHSPYAMSTPPAMRRARFPRTELHAQAEDCEHGRVEPRKRGQDLPAGGADGEQFAHHLPGSAVPLPPGRRQDVRENHVEQ